MPLYEFKCRKCEENYDALCGYEERNKVKCPKCNSNQKDMLPSTFTMTSSMPWETSKWDNFEYRGGFNLEKAKEERRRYEASTKRNDPYTESFSDTLDEGMHDTEQEMID